MKNKEIIAKIKEHHYDEWLGRKIEEETTRDQILFGYPEDECNGIVTTIYASIDVIKKAIELKANLIVAHESLFWNHGDYTDWIEDNQTYQAKKKLLEEHRIAVWRDHDHIHAGVNYNGRRVDGIFFGLLKELGWDSYVEGDVSFPLILDIPEIRTMDLIRHLNSRLHINGTKCIGDLDGYSKRIYLCNHIQGRDNDKIETVEREGVDTIIAMECIDYTLGIYINDASQLGRNQRILVAGHFNLEEPGMKWFGEEYLPFILPDVPVHYVQGGNLFRFVCEGE